MNWKDTSIFASTRLLPLRKQAGSKANVSRGKRVRFTNSGDDNGAVNVQIIEIPRTILIEPENCIVDESYGEERVTNNDVKQPVRSSTRVSRATKLRMLNKDGPNNSLKGSGGSDPLDPLDHRDLPTVVQPNTRSSQNTRAQKSTEKLPMRPTGSNLVSGGGSPATGGSGYDTSPSPPTRSEMAVEADRDMDSDRRTDNVEAVSLPSRLTETPFAPPLSPIETISATNKSDDKRSRETQIRVRTSDWLNANGLRKETRDAILIQPLFNL